MDWLGYRPPARPSISRAYNPASRRVGQRQRRIAAMARCRAVGSGLFVLLTAFAVPAAGQLAPAPQAPDGADLYKRSCAQCHDAGVGRAPGRDQFRSMSPDRVVAAMEAGSMITMAT